MEVEVARVLGRLDEARGAVARLMREAVVAEVPFFASSDDEAALEAMEAACERHLELFVARVGGSGSGPDVTVPWAGGAPLDALLHGCRAASAAACRWLLAQVGEGAVGRAAALRLAELSTEHVDALNRAFAMDFVRTQRRSRDLLERLLAGAGGQDEAATGLGHGPYTTIVLAASAADDGGPADLAVCADALVQALVRAGAPAFGGPRHDEVVVVAAAGRKLATATATEACAGLGTSGVAARAGLGLEHATLSDVPAAYAEARKALRHAPPGRAVALAAVPFVDHVLAEAGHLPGALVPAGVRRLLDEDRRRGGELSRTLTTFADCDLNAVRAAAQLEVHVNTVHHRIGRIEAITGADPRHFNDLVDLILALRLLQTS